jgi:hypothetical protein
MDYSPVWCSIFKCNEFTDSLSIQTLFTSA